MFYIFIILNFAYFVWVIICVREIARQIEAKSKDNIFEREKILNGLTDCKMQLTEEKNSLENDAIEIFTLYEITREITSTYSDKEAFEVFKEKLKKHVNFTVCNFVEPFAHDAKELKKSDDVYVVTLKEKSRKLGYLVVEGAKDSAIENINILANQFAMALRRVKLYEEIEKIAITDSLTDLYTRRYFLERFTEEIDRSRTRKTKMSVLMIDVDLFKGFNDQYGHLVGDQILREVGKIVKDSIREIDIAGRYGGEEFCVVLPETDKEGAYYAAERIRQQTESTVIKAYDASINVTLSVGIATFPDDSKITEELIDKADWALYRAKKRGRNKVCVFGVADTDE